MGHGASVSIVTGWATGVRFSAGIFFSATASRPTLGPMQLRILKWVPGALSLVVERSGREADHSPPSSAEVKNAWSYTSTYLYVFMVWYVVKHSDNYSTLPLSRRMEVVIHCCGPPFYNPCVYLVTSDVMRQ
jgi:hypothetical protein